MADLFRTTNNTPDYTILMEQYLQQIHAYKQQNEEDVLHVLWKGLSIANFVDDEQLVQQLLQHATDYVFYLAEDAGYQYLIESLLAHTWQLKKIKVTLLFILSMIHLQRDEYTQSFYAAKLGYYKAQQLNMHSEDLLLCNAQLQLALSLIYTGQVDTLEKLLVYFNWYMENCRTHSERILIETLLLMTECIEEPAKVTQLQQRASLLGKSDYPFFPAYLLLHLQQFAKKFGYVDLQVVAEQAYRSKIAKPEQLMCGNRYNVYKRKVALHSEKMLNDLQLQYQQALLKNTSLLLLYVKSKPQQLDKMKQFFQQTETSFYYKCFPYMGDEYLICLEESEAMRIQPMLEAQIVEGTVVVMQKSSKQLRFLDLYNQYLDKLERYYLQLV